MRFRSAPRNDKPIILSTSIEAVGIVAGRSRRQGGGGRRRGGRRRRGIVSVEIAAALRLGKGLELIEFALRFLTLALKIVDFQAKLGDLARHMAGHDEIARLIPFISAFTQLVDALGMLDLQLL